MFENFEEKNEKVKKQTKKQGQKKDANIRIQKLYLNIRNEYEYSNIQISVNILNIKTSCQHGYVILSPSHPLLHEPRHEKTNVLVSTWSDTNQAVQLQKMARSLKFQIQKVEGMYYLCSENKGYREANLRLCFFSAYICKMFRIYMQNVGFLMTQLTL